MRILTKSQFNMKQYSMYSAAASEEETCEKYAKTRKWTYLQKGLYFNNILLFILLNLLMI